MNNIDLVLLLLVFSPVILSLTIWVVLQLYFSKDEKEEIKKSTAELWDNFM